MSLIRFETIATLESGGIKASPMSCRALEGPGPILKTILGGLLVLATCASRSHAQDWPDPNPAPQADGSFTYWCGNDMQWDIQEAIDAASPGDTIVIRGGDYVDSLFVDKSNLTIRPFVDVDGRWESVTLWNPTKGPQAQNGWALRIGSDTANTYIGRPRQFRQLASGFVSKTLIVPGEYLAAPGVPGIPVAEVQGECFSFRSRSIDNTGVMSVDGKATVENCTFTSGSGFGGGVVLTGQANTTCFVDCVFHDLFATGETLRTDVPGLDVPIYTITIIGGQGTMNPTFAGCAIRDNAGASILYQIGGKGHWTSCSVRDNVALTNFGGTFALIGASPVFSRVEFSRNESGYGTVFIDGSGGSDLDPLRFEQCEFDANLTIDGLYGGAIYAIDVTGKGDPPKVMLDSCRIHGNNGYQGFQQDDIVSPWFPSYRQGFRNGGSDVDPLCNPTADLNGDGKVDGEDLGIMFSVWGTGGGLP